MWKWLLLWEENDSDMKYDITYTLDRLPEVAEELLEKFGDHRVWAFDAPMGAGKTTLIDEICKLLRIQEVTSSPTFAIVNEYHTEDDRAVYHIDCYRLDDLAGAYRIGLEEYIESGEYCFIEWPEVVTPLLDEEALTLHIEIIDDGQARRLTVD